MKKLLFLLALLPVVLWGTTIHVPAEQATISAALTASANGDTILVAPGDYSGNINFGSKQVTLASYYITTADTTYIGSTRIIGTGTSSVVTMSGSENANTRLVGFTIRGGSTTNGGGITLTNTSPYIAWCNIQNNTGTTNGGGLYGSSASPTIEHCLFKHNTTTDTTSGSGAGLYLSGGSAVIRNCLFTGNSAGTSGGGFMLLGTANTDSTIVVEGCTFTGNSATTRGGAGYIKTCSPLVRNCYITNNTTGGNGGGLYCGVYVLARLVNLLVANNTATANGGGLYFWKESSSRVINCTIVNNTSVYGGGVTVDNATSTPCAPTFTNCIIYGNDATATAHQGDQVAITYSNAQPNFKYTLLAGGPEAIGYTVSTAVTYTGTCANNIDGTPGFIATGTDPFQITPASICRNAGITNFDFPLGTIDLLGNPRIFDMIIDMGCYEQQGVPVAADFSADPREGLMPLNVQFTDLSTGDPTWWHWDFDNDGIVDSQEQNPVYTYTAAGDYSINLTCGNEYSQDMETKVEYVIVGSYPPPRSLSGTTDAAGNAHLTWTAPVESTYTLQNYRVYVDEVVAATIEAGTTQCDLTDLASGQHSVYITAVYSAGESGRSNVITLSSVIMPAPLTLDITDHSPTRVNLAWTMPQIQNVDLGWSDGTPSAYWGLGSGYEIEAAQRFASADLRDYVGLLVSSVGFVPTGTNTYTLHVWRGGHVAGGISAGTLVCEQSISTFTPNQWNDITLNTPVSVTENEEIWIAINANTGSDTTFGHDAGPAVSTKGNLLRYNGVWRYTTQVSSSYNWNWCLRMHLQTSGSRSLTGFNLYRRADGGTVVTYSTDSTTLTYVDDELPTQFDTLEYWVKAVYTEGESSASPTVVHHADGVDEQVNGGRLQVGAYPNPFNPNTTVSYNLPKAGLAELTVYDTRGRLVRHLQRGIMSAGNHSVSWDGKDNRGSQIGSGVYFLRLKTNDGCRMSKILLVK